MAAPDPDIVIPLLETLLKTMSGVIQAYGSAPFSIVDTPSVIVIVGAEQPLEDAGGDELAAEYYAKRRYSLIMCVAPSAVGLTGEVITRVNPFYGALRNLIMSHPRLGSAVSGVFHLDWLGDNGLQTQIEVGSDNYAGTIGSVQVTGRVRVPYAQGE